MHGSRNGLANPEFCAARSFSVQRDTNREGRLLCVSSCEFVDRLCPENTIHEITRNNTNHSLRNATSGSTFVARLAGM
jgi:hypothetical protein